MLNSNNSIVAFDVNKPAPLMPPTLSAPRLSGGNFEFIVNGPAGATYGIRTRRGAYTVRVNQAQPTSGFRRLAATLWLERGGQSEVYLANRTGPAGQCWDMGAARWGLPRGQDPLAARPCPPGGSNIFCRAARAAGRNDGDGLSNLAEFALGTDPTDPESHLRLWLEPVGEGAGLLRFSPHVRGRLYRVESATGLVTGRWTEWPEPPAELAESPGTAGVWVPPGASERRFLRLKVILP